MQFVLDNSVTMRWLFGDGSEEDIAYADHVLELLGEDGAIALVPTIWALEAGNVIARAEAQGLIERARSSEFLSVLQDMAIEADDATFDQAFEQTLQVARQYGISTYDAAYLELALRKGIPLATLDTDLRRAADSAGTSRP